MRACVNERDVMTPRPDVLRACVLQTDPTRGDVEENLERATALVARAVEEEEDGVIGLLLCPEIGFGRYSLDVEGARRAAREEARKIVEWARWAARTLGCHACVGHAREDERTGELFNSQTTVDARGDVVGVYDKTHLYVTDEAWATEGRGGFERRALTLRVSRGYGRGTREREVTCTSAICMDINPYKFENPWDAYELANAARGSELILFSSAWTSAHPEDDLETKRKPVNFEETVSYWVARLEPLIGARDAPRFVCANRVGVENDIQFTGCSCAIDLRYRRPRLLMGVRDGAEALSSCFIELGPRVDDDDDDE